MAGTLALSRSAAAGNGRAARPTDAGSQQRGGRRWPGTGSDTGLDLACARALAFRARFTRRRERSSEKVAGRWPMSSPSASSGVGDGLVSVSASAWNSSTAEAGRLPLSSRPGPQRARVSQVTRAGRRKPRAARPADRLGENLVVSAIQRPLPMSTSSPVVECPPPATVILDWRRAGP